MIQIQPSRERSEHRSELNGPVRIKTLKCSVERAAAVRPGQPHVSAPGAGWVCTLRSTHIKPDAGNKQRRPPSGTPSEIAWLPTSRYASTCTDASRLTGLPNTYAFGANKSLHKATFSTNLYWSHHPQTPIRRCPAMRLGHAWPACAETWLLTG